MLKCSLYKVVVGTNALGNGGILCGLNLVGGVNAHIVEEQVAASLKTGIAGLLLDGFVLALVDSLYVIIAYKRASIWRASTMGRRLVVSVPTTALKASSALS